MCGCVRKRAQRQWGLENAVCSSCSSPADDMSNCIPEPQLFLSQSDPNDPLQLLQRICVQPKVVEQMLIYFSI